MKPPPKYTELKWFGTYYKACTLNRRDGWILKFVRHHDRPNRQSRAYLISSHVSPYGARMRGVWEDVDDLLGQCLVTAFHKGTLEGNQQ